MPVIHPAAWAVKWYGPLPVGYYWPGDWEPQTTKLRRA